MRSDEKRLFGKKNIITITRYLLLISILVFGGWYIRAHFDRIAGEANFSYANVATLLLLNLGTIFIESTRLRLQIRKLGSDLGPLMSWHMLSLMQAVNHVVLKAGTFSGGYFLARRYGISFTSYVGFLVTYVFVMVMASGALGLLLTAFFFLTGAKIHAFIPSFFLGVLLLSSGIIAGARIKFSLHFLPKTIARLFESIRFIYSDHRLLLMLVGVETVYYLASALRFMTAVSMFSGKASLLDGVVVVTVGNFLRIASIIPGGLGIAELASGWTAGLLGGDAGLAGLSAGLDRLTYVFCIMLFGGIGFMAISGGKDFFRSKEAGPGITNT
ncbi:MAG: lysylphosphatidylglycerol synthase domain-containing protein [Candidatus Latescibacterota bacterium]